MPVMAGNLYRALKEVNVPDEMAQKAAEEGAGFRDEFASLRQDIDHRFSAVAVRFERLSGDVRLIKWMLGPTLAGVIFLVLKAYF